MGDTFIRILKPWWRDKRSWCDTEMVGNYIGGSGWWNKSSYKQQGCPNIHFWV